MLIGLIDVNASGHYRASSAAGAVNSCTVVHRARVPVQRSHNSSTRRRLCDAGCLSASWSVYGVCGWILAHVDRLTGNFAVGLRLGPSCPSAAAALRAKAVLFITHVLLHALKTSKRWRALACLHPPSVMSCCTPPASLLSSLACGAYDACCMQASAALT